MLGLILNAAPGWNKGMLVSILLLAGHASAKMHPTPVTINATVDSIEDGVVGLDVSEYPGVYMPETVLPTGMHEGDCVKIRAVTVNSSLTISIVPDPDACRKRRREMQRLRDELRQN